MRNLVSDYDDFLDAVWDFDETVYNARKQKKEGDKTNAEFCGEDME